MKYYKLVGIPRIKQDRPMSCWYESARMVLNSFILGPSFGLGSETKDRFEDGLSNGRYVEFAEKQGLKNMDSSEDEIMDRARKHSKGYPGVNFQNLVYMLDKYGPIWTVIY